MPFIFFLHFFRSDLFVHLVMFLFAAAFLLYLLLIYECQLALCVARFGFFFLCQSLLTVYSNQRTQNIDTLFLKHDMELCAQWETSQRPLKQKPNNMFNTWRTHLNTHHLWNRKGNVHNFRCVFTGFLLLLLLSLANSSSGKGYLP